MGKLAPTVLTAMLFLASAAGPAWGATSTPSSRSRTSAAAGASDDQLGLAWKDVRCLSGCVRFPIGARERARYLLKPLGRGPPSWRAPGWRRLPGRLQLHLEYADFDASSTRTLMVLGSEHDVDSRLSTSATLFAGLLGSPPPELLECRDGFHVPVSLDGDFLAFDETGCVPGQHRRGGSLTRRRLRAACAHRRQRAVRGAGPLQATGWPYSATTRRAGGRGNGKRGELAVWDLQTLTKPVSVPKSDPRSRRRPSRCDPTAGSRS